MRSILSLFQSADTTSDITGFAVQVQSFIV